MLYETGIQTRASAGGWCNTQLGYAGRPCSLLRSQRSAASVPSTKLGFRGFSSGVHRQCLNAALNREPPCRPRLRISITSCPTRAAGSVSCVRRLRHGFPRHCRVETQTEHCFRMRDAICNTPNFRKTDLLQAQTSYTNCGQAFDIQALPSGCAPQGPLKGWT